MDKKAIIKKAKALFKDHAWVKTIYADGDYGLHNALYKVEFDLEYGAQIVDVVPAEDPYAVH